MTRAQRIKRRRNELIAKAALQRSELAMAMGSLRAPLAIADKGVAAVGFIKRHPGISVAVITAVAVIFPRRALRLAQRGLLLWRGASWISSALRTAASRADIVA